MSRRGAWTVAAVVIALAATVAAWLFVRRPPAAALDLAPSSLTGWTLTVSDGTDPWVVGAVPPEALSARLAAQAAARAGQALVAPPHRALPLVLRAEFDDSLQGIYGTDSVLRLAREAGIETATFLPICLAHQRFDTPEGRLDVYFVPFDVPAFTQLRADLEPAQPEHGGIGIYDPAALTPVLVIGASRPAFDQLWPMHFDRARDCEADIGLATTTVE